MQNSFVCQKIPYECIESGMIQPKIYLARKKVFGTEPKNTLNRSLFPFIVEQNRRLHMEFVHDLDENAQRIRTKSNETRFWTLSK
jgi:hypothetical protein